MVSKSQSVSVVACQMKYKAQLEEDKNNELDPIQVNGIPQAT